MVIGRPATSRTWSSVTPETVAAGISVVPSRAQPLCSIPSGRPTRCRWHPFLHTETRGAGSSGRRTRRPAPRCAPGRTVEDSRPTARAEEERALLALVGDPHVLSRVSLNRTCSGGQRACIPNTLPVRRWQARQWQIETPDGVALDLDRELPARAGCAPRPYRDRTAPPAQAEEAHTGFGLPCKLAGSAGPGVRGGFAVSGSSRHEPPIGVVVLASISPSGRLVRFAAIRHLDKGVSMVRLFIRHKVADYGAWRKGYTTSTRRGGE